MTSCVFFVYQVLLLYINVVVKDRLQTAFFHILIHTGERTSVIDLKLLISYVCIFLAFVFLLMISNACRYTGRYLCCTDLGNTISESSALLSRLDTVIPANGRKIRYAQRTWQSSFSPTSLGLILSLLTIGRSLGQLKESSACGYLRLM